MSDLISRQALCEYALNQKDKSVTPNDIMRFPSAEPEIIHCRDCKYSDTDNDLGVLFCWRVSYHEASEDGFCRWSEPKRAERKSDEGEA